MYLRQKQRFLIGLTLVVIAIILLASITVYYAFILEEDTRQEPEPSIGDLWDTSMISPLENQGVIFEILRIRHRGLLDTILNGGRSWKSKPQFYFITNMDNLEYISKDVHAATGESEELFNTWDTMFQENKIPRNAEEETSSHRGNWTDGPDLWFTRPFPSSKGRFFSTRTQRPDPGKSR